MSTILAESHLELVSNNLKTTSILFPSAAASAASSGSIQTHSSFNGADLNSVYYQCKINDWSDSMELSSIVKSQSQAQTNAQSQPTAKTSQALVATAPKAATVQPIDNNMKLIRIRDSRKFVKPVWHAPWVLKTVISGHTGWVRCLALDTSNEWFASGAGDRIIKIWDLATGRLKLSLTGHVSTVRGLAVSDRHPYLFSAGEDKQIKCWDLGNHYINVEYNKVIRHYHGHLSGIYTLKLHPTLDVLVTGGRDATCRVWDMRTKQQVFALTGHLSTVTAIETQPTDPQIVTGSEDTTVKMWDLAAGKCMGTLTHHKKGVRSLALHPYEQSMVTGSSSSIKQWKLPHGNFLKNLEGQNTIVNSMAINADNVLFTGGDNGSMHFWDWKSGHNFQSTKALAQPGSLENEAGIFCSFFDKSGTRLVTGEADKSIKIWGEDVNATEESHPIVWRGGLAKAYGL